MFLLEEAEVDNTYRVSALWRKVYFHLHKFSQTNCSFKICDSYSMHPRSFVRTVPIPRGTFKKGLKLE